MTTPLEHLRSLNAQQRNVVFASFLGWTLDAFDFFILIFVFKDIAKEFNTSITLATTLNFITLAMRPFGALIFGLLADRFGRRPTLMADVLLYSAVEFACGFAPSLAALFVLRGIYGIAMGGEWGVGASLTMESIPAKTRGVVSGILQAGYPCGYLLAAVLFFSLYPVLGWRGMFMVGAVPAFLVLYIRRNVEESPIWQERTPQSQQMFSAVRENLPLFFYTILLMTAFNFFSHGTQDFYPTFLQVQHQYDHQMVGTIAIIFNIGAILGGLTFGSFSEKIGRRRAIVIAALLAIPVIPLWVFSSGFWGLAIGAFIMQFLVQGAWGVIPVHLNELSPPEARGTFPGFTYQLGNLFAAANTTLQAIMADHLNHNYGLALALTAGVVALAVAVITHFGPERRGVSLSAQLIPAD